jgi:hypothetical protein
MAAAILRSSLADDDDGDDVGSIYLQIELNGLARSEPAGLDPAPKRAGLPQDQRSDGVAARAQRLLPRVLIL